MLMQIDETGRDRQAGGVERLLALNGGDADGLDATVLDAEIADGIEIGLRVDDSASGNDEVIILGEGWRGQVEPEQGDGEVENSSRGIGKGRGGTWGT